ncbi:MAG: late competence development ComFB family protein [Oceanicoccus sp.]|uniref:late competence development ComFB family protein n=1 Tax=Oceanicoccus sp. TaxID=2691044 RepID=UPI00261C51D7|nr:late competence development ComFB family protein [Oceanicoccus sp.]MCP3907169.1 late competence development ComFB family protein [Oceanicoccus sp.]MDG1771948.1 late competence development ComFB family protein [Oceanicoccus sp.]
MLLSHESPLAIPTELDSIHNYYERMVFTALREKIPNRFGSNDYTADIACVALNNLPPRYIRHDVDMAFYLSPNERQEMVDKVDKAVTQAIKFVDSSNKAYDAG